VTLAQFAADPAVRVDSHIETGSMVPPYYDSLLGKLIVHGADRAAALASLRQALALCRIDGITTNISLLQRIAADKAFSQGGITTSFLPALLVRGGQ